MRTGAEYLEAIGGDGRAIYADGERVGDVTRHPGFAGAARTIALLYDLAARDGSRLTFTSPKTGQPVPAYMLIPRSRDDLRLRRAASRLWADATYGFMGRTPDHVGSFFTGFAARPSVFARDRQPFADNVVRFYERVRDEQLYVAYTIIRPQLDRSKSAHEQEEPLLAAGVLRETDGGLVIRGAQMLGTGAALADYLFVSCIQPLRPGDEAYAFSVVMPVNAPGLRLYPRRLYADREQAVFDYPLSTRFDETDALAVFRDVFVPWEHVFAYRNIAVTRAQWFDTPAHVLGNTQAQVRLVSKVKFLAGLARRIARVNGVDQLPAVQSQLADVASLAAVVEGMVLAAEAEAVEAPDGIVSPHPQFLYGAMGLQAELYPRLVHLVRELAGGGVMQLPASVRDLTNPDTAEDLKRYVRSPGVPAEERVKLFKLAWDAVGSEFGGRHTQYEMFYAGAPYVAKGYAYRHYDFDEALALVDRALSEYGLQSDGPAAPAESGGAQDA
jgi:4-hydroxyphenylacetate 3-monooxygenase